MRFYIITAGGSYRQLRGEWVYVFRHAAYHEQPYGTSNI